MLFIQHNLLAQNADRQLKASTDKNAKTTEKLSSGYKINRAADDAAGLSISEKMRRQVRGLHQTVDNISEGVGYVQTAEGALNEVQDMLQRINELAVKAANGTNTVEDRAAIDREVQQLKNEMNRIFSETTFNERKIWEPGDRKLLGYEPVLAVDDVNTSQYYQPTVTNRNYDVLPGGSPGVSGDSCYYSRSRYSSMSGSSTGYFTILAKDENGKVADGVKVKWTGYNGTEYITNEIKWDDLKKQNYRFEMSKLFNHPDLFEDDGVTPVFTHEIAFEPADTETMTNDIIADKIHNHMVRTIATAYMTPSLENVTGSKPTVNVEGVVLSYPAAYASMHNTKEAENGHDFDNADADFIKAGTNGNPNLIKYPNYANKNDSTGWEFSFDMVGIGNVKATSYGVVYYSEEKSKGEGTWWNMHEYQHNDGTWHRHKQTKVYTADGTLAGVMSALTGKDTAPGLFSDSNNSTGYIEIGFRMTATEKFDYTLYNGSVQDNETNVGQFCIKIPVLASDSEDDILDKLRALNGNTILDFATKSEKYDSLYFDQLYPAPGNINAPIYGGICSFYVQAGTEGGQHIDIKYEALSTIALGMGDTNALTIESASRAINEVKGALQMVSEQRSAFGAYQNRLEHAQNINANVEENTQSAESLIRDTDIADTMMEYSINNILMQAGTSMLTQANQSSQSILVLLQ